MRDEGRAQHGPSMLLGVLKTGATGPARTGIVTSRRVGTAVVRNRVRRRLREIVRHARPKMCEGLWLVVVAKPRAAKATFAGLREEWTQLARRGGVFRENP